ncbi:MAG: hypothetical protein NWE93_02200 [Candidatus Bathyarchaeota archaeon]|nr:hypothetical protein [Candidatus Bathyarchaeota archaeon]
MSLSAPEVSPEISRFDAENATALTADFLKRLGYKGTWLPMKVSLDGEVYVVEMSMQRKMAKVQINSSTKEIREYEFEEEEKSGGGVPKGKLVFLVAAISVGILLTKLMGVF